MQRPCKEECMFAALPCKPAPFATHSRSLRFAFAFTFRSFLRSAGCARLPSCALTEAPIVLSFFPASEKPTTPVFE